MLSGKFHTLESSKFLSFIALFTVGLFTVFSFAQTLTASDFFSVTSNDSAVINKKKGTVHLVGNVSIIQKTTGSTLITDELFLRRSRASGKWVYAKASPSVEALLIQKEEGDQKGAERKTRVLCDEAVYDKNKSTARLEGSIQIVSHDTRVTADRLKYNLEAESGTVTSLPNKKVVFLYSKKRKPNQGYLPIKPDKLGLVEGKASEIRFSKSLNKLILQGKVTIFDNDELASFTSEKADFYFNQQDELEMIIAYGNVKLTQPKRSSVSDRVDFDYTKEIVTLTGNATLKEVDQLEISSSIIRMHMDEDKGLVESGQSSPVRMKIKIDVQ